MSFLEPSLGDMSKEDLIRLIKQVIHQEVPPIPAGLAELDDADVPLVPPATPNDGQALVYQESTGGWQAADEVLSALEAVHAATADLATAASLAHDIDDLIVTTNKIVDDAIIQAKLAAGSVGETQIIDANITAAKIAALAVGTAAIADLAVQTGKIADLAVTSAKIANLAVGTAQVADAAITNAKINDLDAAKITAGELDAERIGAGTITADKLESVLALVSAILAGNASGANVQVGFGVDDAGAIDPGFIGIRAFDGDGKLTFKVDAQGATAQFRGRVFFGSKDVDTLGNSRLTTDDMIQIAEQPGGSWMTPAQEQAASATGMGVSTLVATWDSVTAAGNVLLAVVDNWDAAGSATHTLPAGWTSLKSGTFDSSNGRQQIYIKTSAGDSGDVTVTYSKSVDIASVQLFEYSGLQAVEDGASATDTGTGDGTVDTGTSGTLTQQSLVFGAITAGGNYGKSPLPHPTIDTVVSGYTTVGDLSASDTNSSLSGNKIETVVWTKVASSGTHAVSTTTTDYDFWRGAVVTLKAKAVAVTSAEADSMRFYVKDVGGVAYPHAVDENGRQSAIVLGKQGEVWRMELATVAVNLPSTAANTSSSINVSIAGLAVGDWVCLLSFDQANFTVVVNNLCTVAGQITLAYRNNTSGTVDPPSRDYHFLVIHRS